MPHSRYRLTLLALLAIAPAALAEQVKLASTGFAVLNVTREAADFYANHLAQQLNLVGVRVITPNEISAILGFDRQRQLLGCSKEGSSCLLELANALGVDGVVTGDVGKFGDSYQINVKIVSAQDGSLLSAFSNRVEGEPRLLDAFTEGARQSAPEIAEKLHKNRAVVAKTGPRNAVTVNVGGIAFGVYSAEYERALTEHWSFTAGPDVYVNVNFLLQGRSENGLGMSGGVHYYFFGEAPQGFFAFGRLAVNSTSVLGVNPEAGFAAALNLGVGYTLVLWNVLDLSLGAGAGPELQQIINPASRTNFFLNVRLRVNVGFVF